MTAFFCDGSAFQFYILSQGIDNMAVEYDDLMAEQLSEQVPGPISGVHSTNDTVVLLGTQYSMDDSPESKLRERIADFPWFTYRRGFPRIGTTTFQSDQGWGCMLRCGQMVLSESFFECHRRGTGTKYNSKSRKEVLRRFADDPQSPYSIHNVALRGAMMNKEVGDWFGPNCMAQVIRSLVTETKEENLAAHVAMDGYVCIEEVLKINPPSSWKPLLLLIPLRLGLDNLNPKYGPAVRNFFDMKSCVGAIGGRPNAAFYFVGYHGNNLLFLDPHKVQMTVGPIEKHVSIDSYTPRCIDQIPLVAVDPSLCLAFLCHSHEEFSTLMKTTKEMNASADSQGLFTVVDKDITSGLVSGEDDFAMDDDTDDQPPEEDDGFELL